MDEVEYTLSSDMLQFYRFIPKTPEFVKAINEQELGLKERKRTERFL